MAKKYLNGKLVDCTSSEIKQKEKEDLIWNNYLKENLWKLNRQTEYPSIKDCIHALLDGGDTLTKLQEKRQEIKAKYPKS